MLNSKDPIHKLLWLLFITIDILKNNAFSLQLQRAITDIEIYNRISLNSFVFVPHTSSELDDPELYEHVARVLSSRRLLAMMTSTTIMSRNIEKFFDLIVVRKFLSMVVIHDFQPSEILTSLFSGIHLKSNKTVYWLINLTSGYQNENKIM